MSTLRQITLKGATGKFRTAVFENKDYIVVPVVALVEGVMQALNAQTPELVLASEFSIAPSGWDGRPVMHNHPTIDGRPVSANSPAVLEQFCFGRMFNTQVVNKELRTEGWIDVAKAAALGGKVQQTVDRVLDGKPVEVSVGVFVVAEQKQGVHEGKPYGSVWREMVPDHLAFLEEGHIGACSNAMGCGAGAAVHMITAEGISRPMADTKRTLRERLKDILPFRIGAKGYSDNDIRDALRREIQKAESSPSYIESVFESDGYFIYATMNPDPNVYEEHYYKRSFTFDKATGTVTLEGDRTEVEPVVYFEPKVAEGQPRAACSCQKTPSESEPVVMERAARIQALIANANCPIKEQAALEALSDAGLTLLEEKVAALTVPPPSAPPQQPPVAPPAEPPVPPVTEPPAETEAQWLERAPVGVREMIARHAAQDAATKKTLVDALKVAQKTYDEAKLNAMGIQQLQEISDLLQLDSPRNTVDFSGRNPLPRAAATAEVPNAWQNAFGRKEK